MRLRYLTRSKMEEVFNKNIKIPFGRELKTNRRFVFAEGYIF